VNQAWIDELKRLALTYALPFTGKIIGAILLWVVGRMVIGALRRVVVSNLEGRKLDATLVRYIESVMGVVLTLMLLLAVLSIFGVETTSFAGVLAAAGVAIGMAWSGLLSNFAAGVFMIVLRPFKVGDMITAAGTTGTVREIGLFATTIDTADNIRTFVGNSKIFSDTIQNYTTNPYRRVELKAQLAHDVDPFDAIKRLKGRLSSIPHVLKDPEPSVELLDFTLAGPVIAVRPFCHNDHYWDVYFATNNVMQEEFSKAGYPVPEYRHLLRTKDGLKSIMT
jgi:small conductance mechanosensitive channel